jgi:hypothetical protein
MQIGRVVLFSTLAFQLTNGIALAESNALQQLTAIDLPDGVHQKISLRSTDRLPEASGAVIVERRGGTTGIDIYLQSMKPASLFGGDYNTYVLWLVPPRGPAQNAGEVFLDGENGSIQASVSLSEFAILITAEPHYLVDVPSSFVVLQNGPDADGRVIQQPLMQSHYNFNRSTLQGAKEARGKVDTDVRQAFIAVRLALRAGAASFASKEYADAQHALEETLALWRQRSSAADFVVQARNTVRIAAAAQRLAENRALQESLSGLEGSGGGRGENFKSAISEEIVTR